MQSTQEIHLLFARAGDFTPDDPMRCAHYARFLKMISREQAEMLFWGLFMFVIMLLVIASGQYAKSMKKPGHKPDKSLESASQRAVRQRCLIVSIICFFLALISVAVEAFAALSIQFCDGEDLMMFYWGFWSLLQVGGLIAILGIAFSQAWCLGGSEEPPWNTALGTPVLLMAMIGHSVRICLENAWKKYKLGDSLLERGDKDLESGHHLTPAPTTFQHQDSSTASIQPEDIIIPGSIHSSAMLVGYTFQREAIYVMPVDKVLTGTT